MELCVVCKKNETARLMDGGWGEKLPVCGECLRSGRWKELLPPDADTSGKTPEPQQGDYLCPKCKVTHRVGSKIHKRHLKLLK